MEYLKSPYRIATSPTAKKTYLGTFLLVYTSLVLLGIASLVYPVFYYNYVPKKLVTLPIHLQYNDGPNPYGVVGLSADLMLEQAYDVSIELTLPRSPVNLKHGNFMMALYAMKTASHNPAFAFTAPEDPREHVTKENLIFSSRRLALIPYEDPLVTTASRIFFLLYHIVFSRAAETVTLSVPMAEMVEFKDMLPLSFLVDVQAGQTLQVYSSTMILVARLSGVRWLMYNHRILAFLVGTTIFWLAEMTSMGLALLAATWFSSNRHRDVGVKDEEPGELSITEGETAEQSVVSTMKGEDDVKLERESSVDLPPHAGDADDEGDSENEWKEPSPGMASGFHTGKGEGLVRRRLSWGGESASRSERRWDD
ncbi:hypothetical protein GGR50DRAFT_442080 [Xylaria sp. CBS 124048]|nr:hypothetical protein GGR50DRAFT_442080 [Xylaria sp. CBS 124048]